MTTLIFDAQQVAGLILESVDATERIPTWTERLDEGARRKGVDVEEVPIETWDSLTKLADDYNPGPKLHFVKDSGIYLMSNATRDGRPDERPKPVYAEGFNPDKVAFEDWWDEARRIVGGDDFVEPLDLTEGMVAMAKLIRAGQVKDPTFYIEVKGDELAYGFEHGGKA